MLQLGDKGLAGSRHPGVDLMSGVTSHADHLGEHVNTADDVTCVHRMIREVRQFDNDTLVMLAVSGNQDAVKERMIREIMSVDEVEWDEAQEKFYEIEAANKSWMGLATFPYKAGIAGATVAAFATFPLCFDLETAKWFNDNFVTADVADPEDLETILEVGSWTWNWMEPPLGQLSFFLLCLQYSRAQMEKIGLKPFTAWILKKRAESLSSKYPKYHTAIIEDYSSDTGLLG